jgi:CheY-like chemotaxis protein
MGKILVVDDETDILRVIVKILQARGHTCETARDGVEALEAVAAERFDVILLDINLPKIDGYEVCQRLKGDAATRDIPVVMLTAAYTTVADAEKGTELGADEYVVKPFLREVLIHNVERWLPGTEAAAAAASAKAAATAEGAETTETADE